MRHLLAALIAVSALLPSLNAAPALPSARPNIIFIMADDLGYTDLACYGSKYYETPHIDRMASQGMRFTAGYSCGPNCQPTRAALMSGQYGPRTGVYTVGGIDRFNWQSRPLRPVDNVQKLASEKITFAETLKKSGYKTGLFGKWHLGQDPEHHPLNQGFDEAIVSMGQHFKFATSPKTEYAEGTYLADFLTDKSIDFIRRHKDEPFLLCLHHFGVHSPFQAKQALIDRFNDKPAAGGHMSPVYAAMIASIDESVGRVLDTLDELKLSANTLVIFTSDNGGVGGYEREGIQGGGITDNAPLKGGKGMLYEGGIRVPYIFRWTGTTEANATCGVPINSVDLYPTLLSLAKAKPEPGYPLDGQGYATLLLGTDGAPRRPLYWHFPGYLGSANNTWRTTPAAAIREANFKLIEFFEDGRLELYDLHRDIGETNNLAAAMPEKTNELRTMLRAWQKQVNAPMPTPNADRKAPRRGARGNAAQP